MLVTQESAGKLTDAKHKALEKAQAEALTTLNGYTHTVRFWNTKSSNEIVEMRKAGKINTTLVDEFYEKGVYRATYRIEVFDLAGNADTQRAIQDYMESLERLTITKRQASQLDAFQRAALEVAEFFERIKTKVALVRIDGQVNLVRNKKGELEKREPSKPVFTIDYRELLETLQRLGDAEPAFKKATQIIPGRPDAGRNEQYTIRYDSKKVSSDPRVAAFVLFLARQQAYVEIALPGESVRYPVTGLNDKFSDGSRFALSATFDSDFEASHSAKLCRTALLARYPKANRDRMKVLFGDSFTDQAFVRTQNTAQPYNRERVSVTYDASPTFITQQKRFIAEAVGIDERQLVLPDACDKHLRKRVEKDKP